jgi:hypothetical protein
MTKQKNLSKSTSGSLLHYIHEIQKFPLLTAEEEKTRKDKEKEIKRAVC